jgi:hypothetical protein
LSTAALVYGDVAGFRPDPLFCQKSVPPLG